jgi:hypothetical protein
VSGNYGQSGATNGIGLFTGPQVVAIRWYCGYGSYAAYGYILAGSGMAIIDEQISMIVANEQPPILALLTLLPTLDAGIQGAAANLDTDQASVWKHNKTEVAERTALFNQYRRRLCELLNVPPGPGLMSGSSVVRC